MGYFVYLCHYIENGHPQLLWVDDHPRINGNSGSLDPGTNTAAKSKVFALARC